MRTRTTFLIATGAALVLLLSACQQGGVSNDDAAIIRQQLEDVANRLDVVEDQIQELADDTTGGEMLISQVRNELNQARSTLAEVDDKLAAEDGEADDALGAPADDGLGDPLGDPAADPLLDEPADTFGDDGLNGNDGFGTDDTNDGLGADDQDDGFGTADDTNTDDTNTDSDDGTGTGDDLDEAPAPGGTTNTGPDM